MLIRALISGFALLIVALDPIGSALSDGVELVYKAGETAQPPWIYDSVHVVPNALFERCVTVARRGQEARETCARGDTLFERRGDGQYRALRPIGAGMEMEVPGRNSQIMTFSTGDVSAKDIDGRSINYLSTSIVTRDSAGVVVRRLREQYAPSLLTALWGVFEIPEPEEGWRVQNEFVLMEIRNGSRD